MNNMIQKMTFLLIVIVTLLSCAPKKEPSGSTNVIEKNQIELNVQNNHRENKVSDAESIPQENVSSEDSIFFLNGRTEFLSLNSEGNITAEGFTIGELFVGKTSSSTEREIIETCGLFFQSFDREESNPYVDPSSQLEISDYYNYFFRNKIQIDESLFGKPKIGGREAVVEMIIFPEAILVSLYLSPKDGVWFITGMEADLRNKKNREIVIDKWAPVMSSLTPGGY